MNVSVQEAFAKVALNKSLLKEYSTQDYPRLVYMDNGSEFQIQIYNSTFKTFAAKIYLNGESLEDCLVVRPAERIWLERYLKKSKKFLFETYEMDDTAMNREIEKMAKNGEIKIEFYKIREKTNPIQIISSPSTYTYPNWTVNATSTYAGTVSDVCYNASSKSLCSANMAVNDSIPSLSACDLALSSVDVTPRSIETGRINEGSHSDQKFSYVDMDFESYPFKTETIIILPSSRKTVEADDLKKRYCPECGRKVSSKHKFCPYCGNKL